MVVEIVCLQVCVRAQVFLIHSVVSELFSHQTETNLTQDVEK